MKHVFFTIESWMNGKTLACDQPNHHFVQGGYVFIFLNGQFVVEAEKIWLPFGEGKKRLSF